MGKRNERIAARAAELVPLDVPDVGIEAARMAKEELETAVADAADQLKALIDATAAAQKLRWELQAELDTWSKRIVETKQELDEVKAALDGVLRDVEGEVAQEFRRRIERLEERLMDRPSHTTLAYSPPPMASHLGYRPW